MAESEEELKRLLMKVKEESEKVGLKLNIQKTILPGESQRRGSLVGCRLCGCTKSDRFPAFPAHLRMRPVSRGNSRRATWVGPHAERPGFPGPLLSTEFRPAPPLGGLSLWTLWAWLPAVLPGAYMLSRFSNV